MTIVVVGNNVGEYVGIFVSTVGIAGDVVGEVLITGGGVTANSGLEVPKTGASVAKPSIAGEGAGEKVESDTAGEAVVLLPTGAAVSSSPGVLPTTAIGDIVGRYVGMYVVGAVVFVAACRFLVLILLPSTLLLLGSSFSLCSNSRRSCIV